MDFGMWGGVILFGIIPTIIYIGIGLYILSLEHIKKRPGYKLPALIYFISVPSLIVIAITLSFFMNYSTGKFESSYGAKPAGYEVYKFLVLKDIIPRSGQSLDEEITTENTKVTKKITQTAKKVQFNEDMLNDKTKLNFKEHGPFYGIKENGRMIRGILKGFQNKGFKTDFYGLFTKNQMMWKGYSEIKYDDGRILYQYNEYKLDKNGKVIIDKDGIYQLVDSYLISKEDFAKVRKYVSYDLPIPFDLYNFDTEDTKKIAKVTKTESVETPKKKVEVAKAKESEQEKFKSNEKYYALVIGNNDYEHLEKLDAAENDAIVIADVLTNKYGFEVELLLNADYDTTVNSLYNITNKLKSNDNLLIYYAGHGELEKAENRGYWLPVDASYELRSKWISNQRIVDRIKATKAKHVLLIADSCFSGTLMRSGITPEANEAIDAKYIERLKRKKTRLVITSGGNEPVVDSDGGDHSLFASKLIDTLKNNNNVINSQMLFENVRRYVVSNADQTPERAQVHKTGHDGGDFLFFPKN